MLERLKGLWALSQPYLRVGVPDPAENLAFAAHARSLTRRNSQATGAVLLLLTLLAWPTDFLIMPTDSPEFPWILKWRIWIAGLSFLGWLFMRYVRPAYTRAGFTTVVLFSLATGYSGYIAVELGGMDSPIYYGVYSTPLITVLLALPLGMRILGTFSVVAAFFGAALLTHPEMALHYQAGTPIVWTGACALTSVFVGHVIYFLLASNFHQRRTLDRRARDLEELARLKNDFFANINHELRTPLVNILGAFRSLERQNPGTEALRVIDVGERNAGRLLMLVNDLLELSRLDSGGTVLNKQVVDVGALACRVADEFVRPTGGLRIDASQVQQEVLAEVDPRQVRTVLYNLLSNAFKFSPPDAEPVALSVLSDGQEVVIRVTDHGEGIPEAELPRIFDRFHQVKGGRSKVRQGVGIGLALVRETVELHGGRVEVASRLGFGTTMEVHLPVGKTSMTPTMLPEAKGSEKPQGSDASAYESGEEEISTRRLAASTAQPPTPGLAITSAGDPSLPLILVCEDNDDLRGYLVELLGRRFRVVSAADGAQGLELARRHAPSLVLTDIMMPEMSGSDLLKALKSDPELSSVPCVFLTALTGDSVRLESLRAGVSDYVLKPFPEEELLVRIDNLLNIHSLTQDLDRRVREQTKELHHLAANLAAVQEGERTRIAREIHDDTGQVLTGLRMELERLRALVSQEPPGTRKEVAAAFRQTDSLLAATHESVDRMINALRPSILDSRGFVSAISWLAEELRRRHNVNCTAEIGIDEEDLSPERALSLYRIVQEALTNVAKHARASNCAIRLEAVGENLVLTIRDDGRGFNTTSPREGFGILGIGERARLLGGTCSITSVGGSGTVIRIAVPAQEEQQ